MVTCFSFALLIPKQFDVPIYVKPFQLAQAVNKPGLFVHKTCIFLKNNNDNGLEMKRRDFTRQDDISHLLLKTLCSRLYWSLKCIPECNANISSFNHKTGSVFPSFNLPPAEVKDSSPWDHWQTQTSVCISICVRLQGEKEKKKGKNNIGVGGGEGWGPAWLSTFSFSYTALTKASLFSWPATRGDALMIAWCLSHGSRLNLSSREKLQSLPFLFTSASRPGAPQINPFVSA